MARGRAGLHGSSGVFARSGQLYRGGPSVGWLQKLHPASRLIAAFLLVLGLSFTSQVWSLLVVLLIALSLALMAFLDITSIYKVAMIPIGIFALPAWLISAWISNTPLHEGSLFFFRTAASVIVVLVTLHSVGLRNVTIAFRWFRLPRELQLVWSITIVQIASFSDLISNMALAREARQIQRQNSSVTRNQIGRQTGVLFSRTSRRGIDLAFALEARDLSESGPILVPIGWVMADYIYVVATLSLVIGIVLW